MSPSPSEVWSLFSVAVKESSVVSSAALVHVIALFNPHDFRILPGEQLENSLYTVEKTVRLRGAQRDEVGGDGEFVAFLRHTFFNHKADCRFSVRAWT